MVVLGRPDHIELFVCLIFFISLADAEELIFCPCQVFFAGSLLRKNLSIQSHLLWVVSSDTGNLVNLLTHIHHHRQGAIQVQPKVEMDKGMNIIKLA